MKKYTLISTLFTVLLGFQVFSQDPLRTPCACNAAKITATENLIALLKTMKNQEKTDEEKALFIKDFKNLNGILDDIRLKCEDIYKNAGEEDHCANAEKLKTVNEDYELIKRVLETRSSGCHQE